MTSSEFTEHFPGLNKVHYPISDGKDFTSVLTTVVGWQNYINIWCIIILCFSLKMYFVDGDKSAGIFFGLVQINKWNSQYKGKHHTLWGACFVKSLCGWWQSHPQGILPPSDIRKERCPGQEVNFMTKY